MKTLSKNSWHYKNFAAWQEKSESRRHRDLRPRHKWSAEEAKWLVEPPTRTPDLCTYTRIALIYGPFYRIAGFLSSHPRFNLVFWVLVYYTVVASLVAGVGSSPGTNFPAYLPFVFPLLLALGACLLLMFILILQFVVDKVTEFFRNRSYEATLQERQPSVVIEYVKARKRKVCPLLEFED